MGLTCIPDMFCDAVVVASIVSKCIITLMPSSKLSIDGSLNFFLKIPQVRSFFRIITLSFVLISVVLRPGTIMLMKVEAMLLIACVRHSDVLLSCKKII